MGHRGSVLALLALVISCLASMVGTGCAHRSNPGPGPQPPRTVHFRITNADPQFNVTRGIGDGNGAHVDFAFIGVGQSDTREMTVEVSPGMSCEGAVTVWFDDPHQSSRPGTLTSALMQVINGHEHCFLEFTVRF